MKIGDFEIINFEEVQSTNDTAAELAERGRAQKLVVVAQRQTAGRGRRGRNWQSLSGNLFFSVLLEFPLKALGNLVMASAVAMLETVKDYDKAADVLLKWPNDVLLNGAKVCGILLEKSVGEYMIIGIGVNVMQSPKSADMLYPTISLREAGINTTAEEFLTKYLVRFAADVGKSSKELRQAWLHNAKGIGQKIIVRQNETAREGVFEGIDEHANLILRIGDKTQKILAGDVFYSGDENE